MRRHLKDYFIPYGGNEYKPHSLQKAAMSGMVLMVLLSFTLANTQSFLWGASDWMVSTVLPAVIVDLTNDVRADDALGQLRRNKTLDAAATLKAQHMAEKGYFAHFSPDGVSPWFWFAQVHYNFVHAGENLAIYFTDSDEVVNAWMDSPTHRANIMNGNYTEIGVGTAEGTFEGFDTIFVVQLFGTPAAIPVIARTHATQTTEVPVIEVPAVVETPIITREDPEVLAESVEITENIFLTKTEPQPVVASEVVEATDAVLEVTNEEVADTQQAMFSDFVSTSTQGIPASIDPSEKNTIDRTPYFLKLFTQPHMILQTVYVAIGLLVFISLILSILIEIRKQHPVQISYGIAMLILMFGLLKIHEILSAGAVIV